MGRFVIEADMMLRPYGILTITDPMLLIDVAKPDRESGETISRVMFTDDETGHVIGSDDDDAPEPVLGRSLAVHIVDLGA